MTAGPLRLLTVAALSVVAAGCTAEGNIRADVAETFGAQADEVTGVVCGGLANFVGTGPRKELAADLGGLPDEEVVAIVAGLDDEVGGFAGEWDASNSREWVLATWDECADRGEL